MDRMKFSQQAEFQSLQEIVRDFFPEMNMMYNLIDCDAHRVTGHLNNDEISFTVHCDKTTAVSLSTQVQEHGPMMLNGVTRELDYTINKDGIDLIFKKK